MRASAREKQAAAGDDTWQAPSSQGAPAASFAEVPGGSGGGGSGSSRSGGSAMNPLWVDKYRPIRAADVCGNREQVRALRSWLNQWRDRVRSRSRRGRSLSPSRGPPPGKPSQPAAGGGRAADGDWSASDGDNDNDDSESDDGVDAGGADKWHQNTLLICGPVGSGKTAALYACAAELGFSVLEV
eukprot:jgi/Mesen1/6264/ME000323S05390